MIHLMNIINTSDLSTLSGNWRALVAEAVDDGVVHSARFLEVYKRINQPGYDAVSQIAIADEKAAVGFAARIAEVIGKDNAKAGGIYRQINHGNGVNSQSDIASGLVIVNPYRLSADEAGSNAAMWNDTKNMMESQHGFISAGFFEAQPTGKTRYHFISLADWTDEAAFAAPFEGRDYKSIVEKYQNKFQICFTRARFDMGIGKVKANAFI